MSRSSCERQQDSVQLSNETNLIDNTKLLHNEYANLTKKELENEIYYHRELLIRSVEGRRIDLLTITSFGGIQEDREERIPNIFPDSKTLRCNVFKGKKVSIDGCFIEIVVQL